MPELTPEQAFLEQLAFLRKGTNSTSTNNINSNIIPTHTHSDPTSYDESTPTSPASYTLSPMSMHLGSAPTPAETHIGISGSGCAEGQADLRVEVLRLSRRVAALEERLFSGVDGFIERERSRVGLLSVEAELPGVSSAQRDALRGDIAALETQLRKLSADNTALKADLHLCKKEAKAGLRRWGVVQVMAEKVVELYQYLHGGSTTCGAISVERQVQDALAGLALPRGEVVGANAGACTPSLCSSVSGSEGGGGSVGRRRDERRGCRGGARFDKEREREKEKEALLAGRKAPWTSSTRLDVAPTVITPTRRAA